MSSYAGGSLTPPRHLLLVETPQIEIDLVSDDPFGQVRGGRLKISGRLAHLDSVPGPDVRPYRKRPDERGSYKIGSNQTPIPWGAWIMPDVVSYDGVEHNNLYLMPIMATSHFKLPNEKVNTTSGLILQRVEEKLGTFERFGIFDLRKTSDADQVLFEEALDDFDLYANKRGLSYTVGKDNKNRYDVVII
jgi:hypothetical protein